MSQFQQGDIDNLFKQQISNDPSSWPSMSIVYLTVSILKLWNPILAPLLSPLPEAGSSAAAATSDTVRGPGTKNDLFLAQTELSLGGKYKTVRLRERSRGDPHRCTLCAIAWGYAANI